jgi:hypothetical protein
LLASVFDSPPSSATLSQSDYHRNNNFATITTMRFSNRVLLLSVLLLSLLFLFASAHPQEQEHELDLVRRQEGKVKRSLLQKVTGFLVGSTETHNATNSLLRASLKMATAPLYSLLLIFVKPRKIKNDKGGDIGAVATGVARIFVRILGLVVMILSPFLIPIGLVILPFAIVFKLVLLLRDSFKKLIKTPGKLIDLCKKVLQKTKTCKDDMTECKTVSNEELKANMGKYGKEAVTEFIAENKAELDPKIFDEVTKAADQLGDEETKKAFDDFTGEGNKIKAELPAVDVNAVEP